MQIKLSTFLVTLIVVVFIFASLHPQSCGKDLTDAASKPALRVNVPSWFGSTGGIIFVITCFVLFVFFIAWASDANRPKLDGIKILAIIAIATIFSAFVLMTSRQSNTIH